MNKILRLLLLVPLACSACCSADWEMWKTDAHSTIERGAIPEPPDKTVHRFFEAQANKAEADDFVVYKNEFFDNGTQLGPYGQYHVKLIANRLNEVPFPVVVQASSDYTQDENRRQSVIAMLNRAGIEKPEMRVIIGYPAAEGLQGEDAERIYQQIPYNGTGGFNSAGNSYSPFYRGGFGNGFFGGGGRGRSGLGGGNFFGF